MFLGAFSRLLAALCFFIATAQAATPYTGFYLGAMHISFSGTINQPERAIGPVGFNINEDGSIVSSGDLTGTVDANGNITWVLPNAGNFITGKVENGVVSSTGSQTKDGLTTTFRVSASNSAPGFGGTSPLAGRIEQVNPTQYINNLNKVKFANGHFMAVGANGSIAFSDDGLNWRRFGVRTTLNLHDIAYGNGMYVVVGEAGLVFTSPDGKEWTARSTGTLPFVRVVFDNGVFYRTPVSGASSRSTDGITWVTHSDSLPPSALYDFGNGVYISGGLTGVSWSTDGSNWTPGTGPTTRIDATTFGNGIFVLQDAAKNIWTSVDGKVWKIVQKTIGGFESIVYAKNRFVAVGSDIHTSLDGEIWIRPDLDVALHDVTTTYGGSYSGGQFSVAPFEEDSLFGNPDFGPGQRPGIRYVHADRFINVTHLFLGDHGYMYYLAGNTNFYPELAGIAPKLTDKTLRGAATDRNNWVVAGGDDGVMILVTSTNSIKRPLFELLPPVTDADILYGYEQLLVGTGGTILRSTNGRTWAPVNSGTTATLRHVFRYWDSENYPGILFVAVGDEGTILTSADGISWTRRNSGTTKRLVGSGYIQGIAQPRLVVAAEDGSLYQSIDAGATWTYHRQLPTANGLTGMRNWGRAVYATGRKGEMITDFGFTPSNPDKMIAIQRLELGAFIRAAALGNGRWVVVGDRSSGFSLDGRNWTIEEQNGMFKNVIYAEGKFVAVADGGFVATSADGLHWRYQKVHNLISAVGYGAGKFVAVGATGRVYVSDDAVTWVDKSIGGNASLVAVIYAEGKFTALGNNNLSAVSTDGGVTWTQANTSGPVYTSIAYGNGRVVTVNFDSRVSTSQNFLNWQSRQLQGPTSAEGRPSFRSVMYHNGEFYASTFAGALYTSTNGLDWTFLPTGLSLDIFAMAAGNGSMLLAGDSQIHMVTMPDTGGPAVTKHPVDASVLEGQTVTLEAGFSGANVEFGWLKDGQPVENGGRISGAHSTKLIITGALPDDAGNYSLAAWNAQGSRATREAEVTVIGKPSIYGQPQSLVLKVGEAGALQVQVTGAGPLGYQWFKNGASISGASSATLDIPGASAEAAGEYYVEITNVAGKTTSAVATVSVRSAPAGLSFDAAWPATPLSFAANPYISTIAIQPNGKIIISGYFTLNKPGGGTINHLARLNADGTFDDSFAPGEPDSQVDGFHFFADGKILVGGYFDKLGAVSTKGLTRLHDNGSIDATYSAQVAPGYAGPVIFAPRADGKLFAGGSFTSWGGVANKYLGLLNADGTQDTSFIQNAGLNNQITSLAVQPDGGIVVGGSFTAPVARLLKITAAGQIDANFHAGLPGIPNVAPYIVPQVAKIAVHDNRIYVAGAFGNYKNQTAVGMMRLFLSGFLDTTFSLGLNTAEAPLAPKVSDFIPIGDKFLVGGRFNAIRGDATKKHIAMVTINGEVAEGLDLATPPNGEVNMIKATADGKYIVMGGFQQFNGQPRPLLARLASGGGATLPLNIVSQPKAVKTEAGATVTFNVAATGHGNLTFQWMKGEQTLTGKTSSSLTLANVQEADLGQYYVVVRDSNSSLPSNTAALTFDTGGGFDDWAEANNIPVGQRAPGDDPEGDGIVNLVEYAFGGNPLTHDIIRPQGLTVNIQGQSYAAVQYTRSSSAIGVDITVGASTTVTFQDLGAVITTTEPIGNGFERVTVRAANPHTTFFFRIGVAQR